MTYRSRKKRKSLYVWAAVICSSLALLTGVHVSAAETTEKDVMSKDIMSEEAAEKQKQEERLRIQKTNEAIMETYLQTEADIQHFAYLDLESSSEELKPVILLARRQIVYRYDWVADDVRGWVLGINGNVEEVLPKFHDLFPADWDLPINPPAFREVDLSYYQP